MIKIIDTWAQQCQRRDRTYIGPSFLPVEFFPREKGYVREVSLSHVIAATDNLEDYVRWIQSLDIADPKLEVVARLSFRCGLSKNCTNPDHIRVPTVEKSTNRLQSALLFHQSQHAFRTRLSMINEVLDNNLDYVKNTVQQTINSMTFRPPTIFVPAVAAPQPPAPTSTTTETSNNDNNDTPSNKQDAENERQ